MGAFEKMVEVVGELKEMVGELLKTKYAERHEQVQQREWKHVTELAEMFSMHRDSVDKLVRDGKEKGLVRVALFKSSKGGKVMQRVELSSFERYLEAGGVEADANAA